MFAEISRRLLAASLVVAALAWPRAANASHDAVQWKAADGGNGHFYEVVTAGPYDYAGALGVASRSVRDGVPAHLATITSAEERAFILSLFPANASRYYSFLGGVQDPAGGEPTGGWSWVTGEPWSYTDWSADPPEPNNFDGVENYLTLQSPALGGRWNDVSATFVSPGIILEYSVVPEPAAALLLPAAFALLRRRRGGAM